MGSVSIPEAASEAELVRQWPASLARARALITGWSTPPLTDGMLDQAPQLNVIVHAAGSVKHLLPVSVWDRGIRVASANDALAIGVAETTLGMIIAGLKGFFQGERLTRSGGWKLNDFDCPGFTVRELYDLNIGLIGASQVGRHLIRLLQQFDIDILLTDPFIDPAEADRLGVELIPLDDLMRRSDVVSLHAPALPSTWRMLSGEQFRLMKDDAIFINTARGSIVDEAALITELKTGRISAILDVTDPEPPSADHPFRRLPNVVLTPHIAGAITNGCLRLGRSAVNQVLEFIQGRQMHGEITAQRLAILA